MQCSILLLNGWWNVSHDPIFDVSCWDLGGAKICSSVFLVMLHSGWSTYYATRGDESISRLDSMLSSGILISLFLKLDIVVIILCSSKDWRKVLISIIFKRSDQFMIKELG